MELQINDPALKRHYSEMREGIVRLYLDDGVYISAPTRSKLMLAVDETEGFVSSIFLRGRNKGDRHCAVVEVK